MGIKSNAINLLNEWVNSDSLRVHCYGVALCMEAYAIKNGVSNEEIDKWFVCGLLHDFDWERYPDLHLHPKKGCEYLREHKWPEEIIEAIMGHNSATGVKRESLMAKTLFAVDELSGLVIALAKIRPGNFEGMSVKSVKKALKKKDFAKAVNRDEIKLGMVDLGLDERDLEKKDGHINLIIEALRVGKKELGFD